MHFLKTLLNITESLLRTSSPVMGKVESICYLGHYPPKPLRYNSFPCHCFCGIPYPSNQSRPHWKENLISFNQHRLSFYLDYMIGSETYSWGESAIIFLVVLSVKINFAILSNKMVSNDIFNQQVKMLSCNWDKLSQKVTKIWQDWNYICNFHWNVNFPLSVFWTMPRF